MYVLSLDRSCGRIWPATTGLPQRSFADTGAHPVECEWYISINKYVCIYIYHYIYICMYSR